MVMIAISTTWVCRSMQMRRGGGDLLQVEWSCVKPMLVCPPVGEPVHREALHRGRRAHPRRECFPFTWAEWILLIRACFPGLISGNVNLSSRSDVYREWGWWCITRWQNTAGKREGSILICLMAFLAEHILCYQLDSIKGFERLPFGLCWQQTRHLRST